MRDQESMIKLIASNNSQMGDLRIDVPCLPVCKQVKLTPYPPPPIYRPFPNLNFFFLGQNQMIYILGMGLALKVVIVRA